MTGKVRAVAFGSLVAFGLLTAAQNVADAKASPLEDEPGWSCVDDGNRVCGPGNSNGVPAGCYDDGGVLFKAWPCEAWQPSDGYRHADGSLTCPEGLRAEINLWTGDVACGNHGDDPSYDTDPDAYVYVVGYTN